MTDPDKKELATLFIKALRARDGQMLQSIMTDDVVWSLPGSCMVSGHARGVTGILERAKHFAAYSLNIEIQYVVFGYEGVALVLHNTGQREGRILDEHLTTVLQLEGNRIKRLDTYISDVQMLNNYFA